MKIMKNMVTELKKKVADSSKKLPDQLAILNALLILHAWEEQIEKFQNDQITREEMNAEVKKLHEDGLKRVEDFWQLKIALHNLRTRRFKIREKIVKKVSSLLYLWSSSHS